MKYLTDSDLLEIASILRTKAFKEPDPNRENHLKALADRAEEEWRVVRNLDADE